MKYRYLKPGSFLPTASTATIDVTHQKSLIGQIVTVSVIMQCLIVLAMKHVQLIILRILTVTVSVIVNVATLLS